MKKYIFLILITLTTINCGNKFDGHIFLDDNGNLTLESSEQKLAGLPFTITLGGTEIGSGSTDANGYYEVDVDTLDFDEDTLNLSDDEICIVVDEIDLQTSNQVATLTTASTTQSSVTADQMSMIRSLVRTLEDDGDSESCDDGIDNDDDGLIDGNDSDCDDSSSSSDDSSSDSSDSGSTTATMESGSTCDLVNNISEDFDVAIAKNFNVVPSTTQSHQLSRATTSITIDFSYPETCDFQLADIPSFLLPDDTDILSEAFVRNVNADGELDLNDAIRLLELGNSGVCDENTSLSRDDDVEKVCPITFNLIESEVLFDESGTIQPVVSCPDDTDITLQEISVSFDGDDDIVISHDVTDGVGQGDDVDVTFTITNNSSTDFASDDMTLDLTIDGSVTGPTSTLTTGTGSCNANHECTFALDSNDAVVVIVSYTLPVQIQNDTDFTITADLTMTFEGSEKQADTYTQTLTILGTD